MDEWATLQTLRRKLSVAEAPTVSWGLRNKRYRGLSSSVGEDSKKSMAIGSRRRLSQDFRGKIKSEDPEQGWCLSFSYP